MEKKRKKEALPYRELRLRIWLVEDDVITASNDNSTDGLPPDGTIPDVGDWGD